MKHVSLNGPRVHLFWEYSAAAYLLRIDPEEGWDPTYEVRVLYADGGDFSFAPAELRFPKLRTEFYTPSLMWDFDRRLDSLVERATVFDSVLVSDASELWKCQALAEDGELIAELAESKDNSYFARRVAAKWLPDIDRDRVKDWALPVIEDRAAAAAEVERRLSALSCEEQEQITQYRNEASAKVAAINASVAGTEFLNRETAKLQSHRMSPPPDYVDRYPHLKYRLIDPGDKPMLSIREAAALAADEFKRMGNFPLSEWIIQSGHSVVFGSKHTGVLVGMHPIGVNRVTGELFINGSAPELFPLWYWDQDHTPELLQDAIDREERTS